MPASAVITCQKPVAPQNGGVDISDPALIYGTLATFWCSEDYMLQGTRDQQCLGSGEWSSTTPACLSKDLLRIIVSDGSAVTGLCNRCTVLIAVCFLVNHGQFLIMTLAINKIEKVARIKLQEFMLPQWTSLKS